MLMLIFSIEDHKKICIWVSPRMYSFVSLASIFN